MRFSFAITSFSFLCALCVSAVSPLYAEDWPQWRGPRGDGITREPLGAPWPKEGLKRLWVADVGIGFTTDGQLASPKLKVIKDTKVIWPKYYPAPVVLQSFLDKNPDAKKILNSVNQSLNATKMRQLNGAVDLEQRDYEDVAREHLEEAGVIDS